MREKIRMRKILIASLVAAGVGLLAGSSGMAAPASTTALKTATPLTEQMQQVGWRGHRCHVRWRSWWHRC